MFSSFHIPPTVKYNIPAVCMTRPDDDHQNYLEFWKKSLTLRSFKITVGGEGSHKLHKISNYYNYYTKSDCQSKVN